MTTTQIKKNQAAAPTAPSATAQAGGGTFAGGVQMFYKISCLVAGVGESIASTEVSATPAASGRVDLTWTPPAGTTASRIYRGTVTNTENVLVAQVQGNVGAFSDTNLNAGAATPPATNAFGSATKSGAAPTKANIPAGTPAGLGNQLYCALVEWCAMSTATTAGVNPAAPVAGGEVTGAGWTVQEA